MSTTQNKAAGPSVDPSVIPLLEQALVALTGALRQAVLYGLSHRVTGESIEQAHHKFSELLAVIPSIEVVALEDQLIFGGRLLSNAAGLRSLHRQLRSREVGKLSLEVGLEAPELRDLAEVLMMDPAALAMRGGVGTELAKRNLVHLKVETGQLFTITPEVEGAKDTVRIYRSALEQIRRTMLDVEANRTIDVAEVRSMVSEILASLLHEDSTLLSLVTIKSYDEHLYEHSVSVCILSMLLGHQIGLSMNQLLDLGVSAILHDVGKVFVPAEIIRKPGPLTEGEWLVVQQHPVIGARILAGTPGLPQLAPVVAYEHHVRWDRSGYPKMAHKANLNLFSVLLGIVDCYDSLTSLRPYRPRLRPEQAVGWMLYWDTPQFEPRLLCRFCSMLKMYPLGAVVKLNSQEWGVIVRGSSHELARPVVRLLVDPLGNATQDELDLGQRDPESRDFLHFIEDVLRPIQQVAESSQKSLGLRSAIVAPEAPLQLRRTVAPALTE